MPFSLGLDGDEAVVHGAVLYGLSRHEPAALGRSITLVEDDLSTEAAGAGEGRGGSKLPKQLAGSAREAAGSQLQELRRAATAVAAIAAARDRLERFVFKLEEKTAEGGGDGDAVLAATQKWLAEGTSIGGAEATSEADYGAVRTERRETPGGVFLCDAICFLETPRDHLPRQARDEHKIIGKS